MDEMIDPALIDETDRVMKCRELIAKTLNLGFVVDAKQASYIGDLFDLDGALIAVDMAMQILRDDEPGLRA